MILHAKSNNIRRANEIVLLSFWALTLVIKGRFSISILGDTRKGKKTGMVCLPRFDQLYYCCPWNTCSLKKKCVFNLKTEQNKTLEMYVILTLLIIIKNVQPITGQRVFYYETDVVKHLQSSPFR